MFAEAIILGLLIEAVTIICRSIFGSNKARYKKIKFKYKIRIHHGYIGILLILIYYLFYQLDYIFIIGGALLLSDIIHHFIVLPILTGKTEFP